MRKLTGVSTHLAAAHERNGCMHGHTWLIRAWWPYLPGLDAVALKVRLQAVIDNLDHTVLPAYLLDGENLAEWVGEQLDDCIAVDVERVVEGFYARWEQ